LNVTTTAIAAPLRRAGPTGDWQTLFYETMARGTGTGAGAGAALVLMFLPRSTD
jgi:hypothetical protein